MFGSGDKPKRFFCPGRVNLIGEHIDYLGGLVMPAAISLGITALIRPTGNNTIRLASTSFEGVVEFDIDNLPTEKQGRWSDYVLGVTHAVLDAGIVVRGFDLLLESTLPKGSGLSSSAALEVLIYFALHSIFGDGEQNRAQMALDCQKVENDFIGVQCGIMDQFAVANGKRNHAILLDCNSLGFKYIPFELGEYSLVIINSNKPRELANSAYNQRRLECDKALEVIREHRGIENLVHATESDLNLIVDSTLKKRTRHAFSEQQRVLDSEIALRNGDVKAFGKLLSASHQSLKNNFEVSCAELDFIVNCLNGSGFCLGSRMTGAGFGGCCIAIIKNDKLSAINKKLEADHLNRFGLTPSFYVCQPSEGVQLLVDD